MSTRKSIAAVAAGMLLMSSAAFAGPASGKHTVTLRTGQGDRITVPTDGPRQVRPHELTGRQNQPEKTVQMRTGQGGFVTVPTK